MNAPVFRSDRPQPARQDQGQPATARRNFGDNASRGLDQAGVGPVPVASGWAASAGQGPSEAGAPDPTAARPPLLVGLVVSLALVLGFGGWAVFAAIDGAIITAGQVAASRTRLVIQHPDGGRIALLAVQDGQRVAEGELLAQLDPGLLSAEREIIEAQFLEALARQTRLAAERMAHAAAELSLPPPDPGMTAGMTDAARERLAELLDGQTQLMAARHATRTRQLEQLDQRRAQASAQRDGLAAQIEAAAQEIALIAAELAQQTALVERGLAGDARLSALRREAARMRGAEAAGRAELAAVSGRIAEIELERLVLQAGRREEIESQLRDLGLTLAELATRRQLLDERLRRLEIRAPRAGRIHALGVGGAGAVLRPAEPLAELVPDMDAGTASGPGTPIVALQLPPDDLNRVQPGQPVRLWLPASAGRDRPELQGRITLISADLLDDPQGNGRHYRAEVTLEPAGTTAALDAIGALYPGLPVEAHIVTGSRSPLQWFIAPITAQINRALRDD